MSEPQPFQYDESDLQSLQKELAGKFTKLTAQEGTFERRFDVDQCPVLADLCQRAGVAAKIPATEAGDVPSTKPSYLFLLQEVSKVNKQRAGDLNSTKFHKPEVDGACAYFLVPSGPSQGEFEDMKHSAEFPKDSWSSYRQQTNGRQLWGYWNMTSDTAREGREPQRLRDDAKNAAKEYPQALTAAIIEYLATYTPPKRHNRMVLSIAFAAVIIVVLAVLAWAVLRHNATREEVAFPVQSSDQIGSQGTTNLAASPASEPVASAPQPVSQAVPVANDGPCTIKERDTATQSILFIEVPYWCHGNSLFTLQGIYKQNTTQWKLRLVITNTSSEPMDISITNPSSIRLLIEDERDITQLWHPTEKTLEQGDAPVKVCVEGVEYWAIPPNAPFAEDVITIAEQDNEFTLFSGFSTYWDKSATIQPGETVGTNLKGELGERAGDGSWNKGDPSSDLVFEAPNSADNPNLTRVAGVGIFRGPQDGAPPSQWELVGWTPFAEWGTQYDNNHF